MNPKFSRYYTYIKPVVQNPTVKSVAPHIFSLLTIILFILLALRPTISTIINLQETTRSAQDTLEKLETKGRSLEKGTQNLNNLDTTTKTKIKTSIPDQVNIGTLIASLQNSAEKGSTISAIQIQPLTIYSNTDTVSGKSLGEINFSFNVYGNYPQLISTIQNLVKSPRTIKITTLSMSKQPEGANLLSVTGKAFFLK